MFTVVRLSKPELLTLSHSKVLGNVVKETTMDIDPGEPSRYTHNSQTHQEEETTTTERAVVCVFGNWPTLWLNLLPPLSQSPDRDI